MLDEIETISESVVYVRSRAIFPVSARDFISRESVTVDSSGVVTLTSIPEPSIVRSSPPSVIRGEQRTQWVLEPRDGGTRVTLRTDTVMNGWVPAYVSRLLARTAADQPAKLALLIGDAAPPDPEPSSWCCCY